MVILYVLTYQLAYHMVHCRVYDLLLSLFVPAREELCQNTAVCFMHVDLAANYGPEKNERRAWKKTRCHR